MIHLSQEYLLTKARELLEAGATVVDVLSADELEIQSNRFMTAMSRDLPEYVHRQPGSRLTFDPSGKLGGSSSHHICVRELRAKSFAVQKTIIRCMLDLSSGKSKDICMETLAEPLVQVYCIPDAAMVRCSRDKISADEDTVGCSGDKITAGNWHRDFYKQGSIFGGWLNLDASCEQKPQPFLFGEGSHMDTTGKIQKIDSQGFSKLSKEEISALKKRVLNVHPGQMLMFWEHISHAVCNNATRRRTPYMLRLFTACGICNLGAEDWQSFDTLIDKIRHKLPLPIKGGKEVPLISRQGPFKNAKMYRIEAWKQRNLSEGLRQISIQDLDRGMGAMTLQLSDPNFPDYDLNELAMYKPQPLLSRSRKRWRSGCLVANSSE